MSAGPAAASFASRSAIVPNEVLNEHRARFDAGFDAGAAAAGRPPRPLHSAAFAVHYGGLPFKWEVLANETRGGFLERTPIWGAASLPRVGCPPSGREVGEVEDWARLRSVCTAGPSVSVFRAVPRAPARWWRLVPQESPLRRAVYLLTHRLQIFWPRCRFPWRSSALMLPSLSSSESSMSILGPSDGRGGRVPAGAAVRLELRLPWP